MLKGNRNFSLGNDQDISCYATEAAEAGIIMVYTDDEVLPPGLGDSANAVAIPADNDDGVPAGLLLNDVLDFDVSETSICNGPLYGTWSLVDRPCVLAKAGWYVTDMVKSGDDPDRGDDAYYEADGELSTSGVHLVGVFESSKDSDGFVRVRIKLN